MSMVILGKGPLLSYALTYSNSSGILQEKIVASLTRCL